MLVPSQKVELLGFIVDSVEMIVSLPERKIIRLRKQPASPRGKNSTLFEN